SLEERIIARVANGNSDYFDSELFYYITEDLLKAVQTTFKENVNNADYAYNLRDDSFITALEQNLFHFSAAKTLSEIQELNKLFRESGSFEEFSKKAGVVCDTFNKKWQKTEYETAVLTAESASNYQRLLKKKNLFPYWKYTTAGDDKVREEHRKLDGIVLSCDDPHWNKIFPPNGWKCRCRVVPVMRHEVSHEWLKRSSEIVSEYYGTTEWKMVEQQHWDSNRGKRAEVFNKDQMYIRKFPDMAAKYMDKVSPAQWGAESSFKKLIGTNANELKEYGGTAESWWNDHKKNIDGKELLAVADYKGRTWYMEKKDYDVHTTNQKKARGFRAKYLSCITEIMSDPDEVWLSNEYKDRDNKESRLNNWILIKYYKGIAIACVCKLDKEKMTFKSWYEVRNPKIRKGLLIKKK
ncbi:MAG: phage minor head protein, partial [Bacteroidales bacterium]